MNKPELPPCLVRLSLGLDADPRAIRSAYARELKLIDQEADAAGFQYLREQYEAALQWHAWETWEAEEEQQQEPMAAEPAADADLRPQDLAHAVFQRLVVASEGLSAAPESTVEQWEQAIRTHLTADELYNVDARIVFEQTIVDWLAAGWIPGKEKLFAAAPEVFGWEQDPRRLRQFGYTGGVVSRAMDERAIFLDLPAETLTRYRDAIARLRASFEPDSGRNDRLMRCVEQLMLRFPHLMALSVSQETVQHWREVFVQRGGTLAQAQHVATPEPKLEESGGGFPWFMLVFALIMLGRGCSSMGSSSSPSPPSERFSPSAVAATAPVVLDRNVLDAIGADLRYTFPKGTPRGTYTFSFDMLIDLQGNATILATEKSPYPDFDQAVQEAVLRAQPFANEAGRIVKFSHSVTVQ